MEKIKIARKVYGIKAGRIHFVFILKRGDMVRCVTVDAINSRKIVGELPHLWPSLTPGEVRGAFGTFPQEINTEWSSHADVVLSPVEREAIKRITARVLTWIRTGIHRCEELAARRNIEGWLWHHAEADAAGGPLQPIK